MIMKTKSQVIRFWAVLLAFSLVLTPVYAAVPETAQPMASDYLSAYSTYICAIGNGDLQIWWNITGAGTQVDLGVLRIVVYESPDNVNWTWVKTYNHTNYANMLSHNDDHHMDYVYFQGTREYYYKAYVTIYGGNGTTGDSRYKWTGVEQAY